MIIIIIIRIVIIRATACFLCVYPWPSITIVVVNNITNRIQKVVNNITNNIQEVVTINTWYLPLTCACLFVHDWLKPEKGTNESTNSEVAFGHQVIIHSSIWPPIPPPLDQVKKGGLSFKILTVPDFHSIWMLPLESSNEKNPIRIVPN